jgi:hypothetical protein
MKNQVSLILICLLTFACSSCSNPKSKTYFEQHPEEIKVEANRCLADWKKGKDIQPDMTCKSVYEIESEQCERQQKFSGNTFNLDCHNPLKMLSLAASGY